MASQVSIHYPCLLQKQSQTFLVKRFLNPTKITKEEFNKYYASIYTFQHEFQETDNVNEFLENLFHRFNSDENPLATKEYQDKIEKLQAHTSMSMGDVIKINDTHYIVDGIGIKEIKF
ncbi:hypothetical protein Klosneuvirus_3_314 [Klosneuvirus KNV1]|uniref:Uncharacterized protein n=1 Tax=Klosneuvirus KNV1 TaxID=1977640 RepID=A0A1V0SKA5_9VIRU|nr:hypothetical protein Klosneuvirus_3_314 [Klosneuvirus KNV1]